MCVSPAIMKASLLFWLLAFGLVSLSLALLFWPALRRSRSEGKPGNESAELLSSRLSELEDRRAAGELSEAEYRRDAAEIERRALEEIPGEEPAGWRPEGRGRGATSIALVFFIPAAAFAAYLHWGNPGILDLAGAANAAANAAGASEAREAVAGAADPAAEMEAQAERRAQAGITPQTPDDELERWCRSHPEDGRAAVMLARRYADKGRFGPASAFYAQALSGDKKARNPVVLTEAAAALVSMPEPMSLEARMQRAAGWLDEALLMQPGYGNALQVRCAIAIEREEWGVAERLFRAMAEKLPPGSAERVKLEADAARAAVLTSPGARGGARKP